VVTWIFRSEEEKSSPIDLEICIYSVLMYRRLLALKISVCIIEHSCESFRHLESCGIYAELNICSGI